MIEQYLKKIDLGCKLVNETHEIMWARQTNNDGSLMVGFYPNVLDNSCLYATRDKLTASPSLYEPVYKRNKNLKISLHPDGNHTTGGLNIKNIHTNDRSRHKRLGFSGPTFKNLKGLYWVASYIVQDVKTSKIHLGERLKHKNLFSFSQESFNWDAPLIFEIFLEGCDVSSDLDQCQNIFEDSDCESDLLRFANAKFQDFYLSFLVRQVNKTLIRIDNEIFTIVIHGKNVPENK